MIVKYKVSDFAKDLNLSAKKVLDELAAMGMKMYITGLIFAEFQKNTGNCLRNMQRNEVQYEGCSNFNKVL